MSKTLKTILAILAVIIVAAAILSSLSAPVKRYVVVRKFDIDE